MRGGREGAINTRESSGTNSSGRVEAGGGGGRGGTEGVAMAWAIGIFALWR